MQNSLIVYEVGLRARAFGVPARQSVSFLRVWKAGNSHPSVIGVNFRMVADGALDQDGARRLFFDVPRTVRGSSEKQQQHTKSFHAFSGLRFNES